MRAAGLAGVLTFALAGCGGGDDAGTGPGTASGGGDSIAVTAEPVDTCALFTADDFASVVGKPAGQPEKQEPQGSLLGGCTYLSKDVTVSVYVTARPGREWDDSVKAHGDVSVSGVGEKAFWADNVGLLVQPAGKPYFLQVLAMPDLSNPTAFGKELSVAVGQVAADR
ncbi:hypothetical protein [Micromonospora sp. NBC_01638]|uniref:hypothetical protein n=1 Tax=Micromonospora sp. NBC_01638 TaxID=2975982 RepID=UPI00386C2CD8|nr:hypothetical protein OG811_25600 [Micromonospora sp. NBC_01638]